MNVERYEVIELIQEQIKDQCGGKLETDLEWLRVMQNHIYQWIKLFGLTEEDLKDG